MSSSFLIISIESLFCAHYWVICRDFKLRSSFCIILIILKDTFESSYIIWLFYNLSSNFSVCTCVWKPVVSLGCLFQELPPLLRESVSLGLPVSLDWLTGKS